MAIFGFGKKKDEINEEKGSCSCGGACETKSNEQEVKTIEGEASVKVLGSGCAKCIQLEANVKIALEQLGMDSAIEHVTDFSRIAAYGVMTTPALVVEGKVLSYGKVLKVEEVVKLFETVR